MDRDKIEVLYKRLADERRRLIGVAADSATLPPSGLLAQIAVLDSSISAIEAVIDELNSVRSIAAE
ncbi:hypothetical protein [Lichenifustis flavocetrariae]|uniref:Uncharacterized protein n=1 Tax=Lichenifustis flavocetrariae TaxID=2949735 RepID=A0AA41Z540_9HYPH|nr:hypothetical protein [Lichenifustis flavocetrariae]MCW6509447.1 hypothetical protein [Lichenifustis flavocetrariae]